MTTHQPGLQTAFRPSAVPGITGCYPFSTAAAECEHAILRWDTTGQGLWIPCGRTDGSCTYCAKIHRKSVWLSTKLFAEDLAAAGQQLWFVTLTGPGFGPVHRPEHCPCGQSHASDAEAWVGAPIDPDTYDYDAHRTWNLGLAKLMTATARRMKRAGWQHVRVLEMQRRQVAHFHLVVATAPGVLPPDLVKLFAETSRGMTDPMTGERYEVRWGPQIDVRPLGDDVMKAASYVAKYVAKSVASRPYQAIINDPQTPLELHIASIYSNSICDCDADGEETFGPDHWLTCSARQHHRQGGARSRSFWSSVPEARLAARRRERVAEAERLREASGIPPLPPLPPATHVEVVREGSEKWQARVWWWQANLEQEHEVLEAARAAAEARGAKREDEVVRDVVAEAEQVVDREAVRLRRIPGRPGAADLLSPAPQIWVTEGYAPWPLDPYEYVVELAPDEWPADIDVHGLDDPHVYRAVPRAPPE